MDINLPGGSTRLKRNCFRLRPGQTLMIGFAITIAIGAILLALPIASTDGQSIGPLAALFTSTSAVCVTGLIVVDTGTQFTTFGHVIIMLLIQIGGLGFMTAGLMIFFATGRRITLKDRLTLQEAMNEESIHGIVRAGKRAIIMTFAIELVAAVILSARFSIRYGARGIFMGVFNAVSAFCNAGFDLFGNFQSLTIFQDDPIVLLTIGTLIVTGGLGFIVIYEIVKVRHYKKFHTHAKMVILMTSGLLLLGFVLFAVAEWNNPDTIASLSVRDKLINSAFQSITPRTAGYNSIDQASMTPSSKLLTLLLMFVGASPASTGGGVKTTTFAILLLSVRAAIRGKADVEFNERRFPPQLVQRAMSIFGIYLTAAVTVTFLICLIENLSNNAISLEAIVFETLSAFGTVGLSYGITPDLHAVSKLLLIVSMFIGRLGPLTLAIALARRAESTPQIRYPEVKVMVG